MTNLTPLSPVAQAVLDAAHENTLRRALEQLDD